MDTEQRLRQAMEKRQSILLAKKHLSRLDDRIGETRLLMESMLHQIEMETKDVEYFEDISTNFLFRKILGGRNEQLEIHRQEQLQAILDYKEAKRRLELMEFERKVLVEKVAGLPRLDNEIEHLVHQREQELLAQGKDALPVIHSLNRELGKVIQLRREIYEVKIVGIQSAKLVQEMSILLRNAMEQQSWGWSARIFGKSRKNDFVHLTLEKFYQLKNKLREFSDGLKDIYLLHNVREFRGMEQFQSYASGYYDSLISDWIVRNRIINSLNMMGTLHDGLVRSLASLKQEEERVENQIQYLESRKKAIILETTAKS